MKSLGIKTYLPRARARLLTSIGWCTLTKRLIAIAASIAARGCRGCAPAGPRPKHVDKIMSMLAEAGTCTEAKK
jgi:hypothetical protein